MARISTHVLDIARGKPAEGIAIELYRGDELVRSATTNADGRTDEPLLQGDIVPAGDYELRFHARENLFFNVITIHFHVTDPLGNYHVPLLLAPYGYSTYRGS